MFKKHSIEELRLELPREDLVRRSRILVVDDEKPELIQDLQNAGFSVDYVEDITTENMSKVETLTYDLMLLDFGNVGTQFGENEGLDLLRHIKRVAPSIVVLTYTSKALSTKHAEFYRQADGMLAKDAGIGDSLVRIEQALAKAHTIDNSWNGLLAATGVVAGSKEDIKLQDLYVRGLSKKAKLDVWQSETVDMVKSEAAKAMTKIFIGKLIELGMKAAVGA